MKKLIRNKNKGILFFVFGLSGSGKTAIAKKITKRISHSYGPTIEISGNDMRKTFKLNNFSQKVRKETLPLYNRFKKLITDKKINLIFNVTGNLKKDHQWNRKNKDNYVEIFIKTDIIGNLRSFEIIGWASLIFAILLYFSDKNPTNI